jgi:hypothetical protein
LICAQAKRSLEKTGDRGAFRKETTLSVKEITQRLSLGGIRTSLTIEVLLELLIGSGPASQ